MSTFINVRTNRNIPTVTTYADLPPAVTNVGEYYWVENSQGTAWLPGTLGGTYYPKGLYYSNSIIWNFMESPTQATQAEVDLGVVSDKFVTPETLTNAEKWDEKVNITDLPSNLTLYPTTVASGVGGYNLAVSGIEDPDYDNPFVAFSTGAITGTDIPIGSWTSTPGLLTGNPGVINVTLLGSIKRSAGSGIAVIYYEVYQRTSGGIETLAFTSSPSRQLASDVYVQFTSAGLLDNGVWLSSDRIVIKFFATKIGGGSNPTFDIQLGGTTPLRLILPVPARTIVNLPITIDETSVLDGTESYYLYIKNGKVSQLAPTITVDVRAALVVDFAFGYSYKINSVSNVIGSPTTTIKVNAVSYTLGDTINANDLVEVTVTAASIVTLNIQRL